MCVALRYHTHYLCLLCVASSAVSDGLGVNLTVLTGDWSATVCSWSLYMRHCKNNAHLNFVTKVLSLTENLTCLQHSAWWLSPNVHTCQQVLATDAGSSDTMCCDCLHPHNLLAVRGGSRMCSCHIAVVTSELHWYLALSARCMQAYAYYCL